MPKLLEFQNAVLGHLGAVAQRRRYKKQVLLMMNTTALNQQRTKLWIFTAFLSLACSVPGAVAQLKKSAQSSTLPMQTPVVTTKARATPAVKTQTSSAAEKGALVRFIMAEYNTTKALASRVVSAAYLASARHEISPSLVLAIISRESTFNPRAQSGYGAQGLMQVVPRFHQDKLQEVRAVTAQASLFHPETNIDVGTRILAEYIEEEAGLHGALRKYSGSAHRYIEKVLRARDTFERVRLAAGADIGRVA